ncbi:ribonuclease HII [Estrella lausannensis]|uniref:Ribonuclease HII n=1 Tax=Estrella lausannensis TaxID=483423 RepID=A0A0H5E7Z5_9BACT|nr:ribonuclease HII [Estrella lausannensis]CRX39465.1 Ribonuclease HII [Estrella lausannensis]
MSKDTPGGAEEMTRLYEMTSFEREASAQGHTAIAGVDEAGRGPLAGPVVAAAAIVPPGLYIPYINDSKKLSPARRKELFHAIKSNSSILTAVGIVSPDEIDRINIYQATQEAMRIAVRALPQKPDILLVDGMKIGEFPYLQWKIIKGDALSQSIAAASIIAKETRDALMEEYDRLYPGYGFLKHKGYGTAMHLDAIEKLGPCPIHRRSFAPIRDF